MLMVEGDETFRREVYDHLCKLAHNRLRQDRPGETLNTMALVHETFIKLSGGRPLKVNDKEHYYAVAARAMRQIVIDYARKKKALRRGGDQQIIDWEQAGDIVLDHQAEALLRMNNALETLAAMDERVARVVEIRYFAGLPVTEVAEVLGVSEATVKRDCRTARAFLLQAMEHSDG